MPNYDFYCSREECDFSVEDVQLPIAARDFPTTEPCPTCSELTVTRVIAAPLVSYTAGSVRQKTPEAFKDIVRNIKKHHRGSTIDV